MHSNGIKIFFSPVLVKRMIRETRQFIQVSPSIQIDCIVVPISAHRLLNSFQRTT